MESREIKSMFTEILDKKNIRVLSESTIDGLVNISIDYTSLDEYNKLYAESLVSLGLAKFNQESKVISFIGSKDKLCNLLGTFEYQDILYGFKTLDEVYTLITQYKKTFKDSRIDYYMEDTTSVLGILMASGLCPATKGLYFDYFEGKFWESSSLYDRHARYKDSLIEKQYHIDEDYTLAVKLA